jgi:hypothetical protein
MVATNHENLRAGLAKKQKFEFRNEMHADDTLLATPAKPPAKSHLKRNAWLAAGLLLLLLGSFLFGYVKGRGELGTVTENAEKRRSELSQCKTDLAKTVEQKEAQFQLLEARRCLDQSLTALDFRNFGTAQQKLKDSAQKLVLGQANGRLLALAKELESFKLTATDDVGSQRQKIANYVSEFDKLFPSR